MRGYYEVNKKNCRRSKFTNRIISIFALSAAAFTFFYSSSWAYGWMAEIYPLGDGFITLMFCIIGISSAVSLISILLNTFKLKNPQSKGTKIFKAVHIILQ